MTVEAVLPEPLGMHNLRMPCNLIAHEARCVSDGKCLFSQLAGDFIELNKCSLLNLWEWRRNCMHPKEF